MQNESFWNAKGLVLKFSCSNLENQLYNNLKKGSSDIWSDTIVLKLQTLGGYGVPAIA